MRTIERLVMGRRAYKFLVKDWVALPDARAAADVLATMRFSVNMEPIELSGPGVDRVVVIAPHPDDEMIGPGGTLIRALDEGTSVHVLYLSDAVDPSGSLRLAESAEVAERVGYSFELMRRPEGKPEALADAIAERLRTEHPGAVFVPFLLDDHPDHRAASLLLAKAHNRGGLPDGLEVWAYQVYTSLPPNVIVDITEVAARKRQAIQTWRDSAMRSRDWAHYALGLNAFNSRFRKGPPGEHYVEAFFVLPLGEYSRLCGRYERGLRPGPDTARD